MIDNLGLLARHADDWEQAKGMLANFKPQWVFRGHSSAAWTLKTSLERLPIDIPADIAEGRMLREFRRRAHHYPEATPLPESTLDWLALMQHYGAPTRLLDFTRSPYVAAFFALEDVDADEACAVWAVDEQWCRENARRCVEAGDPSAMDLPLMCDFSEPELFDKHVLQGTCRFVVPVEPFRLHQRMTAQQGLFLCPGQMDASFLDNLAALAAVSRSRQPGLQKIVIKSHQRAEALRDLNRMNINRSTLFPGIEGLARSLPNRIAGVQSGWESVVRPKPQQQVPVIPLSEDDLRR